MFSPITKPRRTTTNVNDATKKYKTAPTEEDKSKSGESADDAIKEVSPAEEATETPTQDSGENEADETPQQIMQTLFDSFSPEEKQIMKQLCEADSGSEESMMDTGEEK